MEDIPMHTKIRWSYLTIALLCNSLSNPVLAEGDLTRQDPITIPIFLGDDKNSLRFYPSRLTLETGKLYRLLITNPSPSKHYFSSYALSHKVHTRKVQVLQANKQAAVEVKGVIREIEVYPGQTAEWWFVPVQTGTLTDLHCSIKGHREAGMVGQITIR